jgi:RNA methyltransferase, TrmH family
VIAIRKLMTLSPLHRARKAAQTLGHIEEDWRLGDQSSAGWVVELAAAFAADSALPDELRSLAEEVCSGMPAAMATGGSALAPESGAGIRLVNRLARALEAHAGVSPADWDFREPLGTSLVAGARRVYPGIRAYLEDIRSPFNVGSIFRSADAFGVSELIISGFTADPAHQRAVRSAMGATEVVPWRRGELGALGEDGEAFALELRGEPIDSFEFPQRGIVVIGSEELGVSPEAMNLCRRTVSIPMLGAKGSLNVGVAFGVLMAAWRRSLESDRVEPVVHGSI